MTGTINNGRRAEVAFGDPRIVRAAGVVEQGGQIVVAFAADRQQLRGVTTVLVDDVEHTIISGPDKSEWVKGMVRLTLLAPASEG